MSGESEWKTRKKRIDPKLDAISSPKRRAKAKAGSFHAEEEETAMLAHTNDETRASTPHAVTRATKGD